MVKIVSVCLVCYLVFLVSMLANTIIYYVVSFIQRSCPTNFTIPLAKFGAVKKLPP